MPAQMLDDQSVLAVAEHLGLRLTHAEAVEYSRHLRELLGQIDNFMREGITEGRPPILAGERRDGRQPTDSEDPLHAWTWKCEFSANTEGPLKGKTVGFKDHIAVGDLPLTLGTYLLRGYRPDFDATVVTRALQAGAIIIGKNSMNGPTSGWGFGSPGDFARPLNPHAPDHITGGSSSGSAVAVAAGEVDISYGGDNGGSIRIPAAYCGVYGLKPTFGLISHFGITFGADPTLDYVGPLTRDAEDLAAALDAVAGYDPLDPRQDRGVPATIDTLATLKDGVDGVRIGVVEEGFVGAEQDVADAVRAAIDTLVVAGAEAVNTSVPSHLAARVAQDALALEGSRSMFDVGFAGAFARTYYPTSLIVAAHGLYRDHADLLVPRRKIALIASEFTRRRYQGAVYAKAQNVRRAIIDGIDRAFTDVDVLVMPTCLETASRYETAALNEEKEADYLRTPAGSAVDDGTRPFNFTGHPALTVPCGRPGGLPVGMQLVGRFYSEPLLLRMAYAFQNSVDWAALTGLPVEPRLG